VVGVKTRNPERSNTILLSKHNDMTSRLENVGVNEIRPKYNRSVLENQAYYSHSKPIKHVAAPWAMETSDSTFSTFEMADKNRRKAKSVLRTIPGIYEEEPPAKSANVSLGRTRNSDIKKPHSVMSNSFFTP
jgi:hypothetical protein